MNITTKQALQEATEVLRDLSVFLAFVQRQNEDDWNSAVADISAELQRLAEKSQQISNGQPKTGVPFLHLVAAQTGAEVPAPPRRRLCPKRSGPEGRLRIQAGVIDEEA